MVINEDQIGKCYYCGREFPINTLQKNHIFPLSKSNNFSSDNICLVCSECNSRKANHISFSELELISFLKELLDLHPDYKNIKPDALISNELKYRADIIAEQKINGIWTKILIELKSNSTFTTKRLIEIANQLQSYSTFFNEKVKLVFAFPGILTEDDYSKFRKLDIDVWDREYISKSFQEQIQHTKDKYFQKYFSVIIAKSQIEDTLINGLHSIPYGRDNWSRYQKHIGKILSFLFSDILSEPITELPDILGINRRDFILRNYCENGFWKYLRERYQGDFIVIDAKNYSGKIKKNQILQISNYLKLHGTGLFALIISRNGLEDTGSYFTRREVWVTERKMIIILDDSDMEKMILSKASSNLPEEIIKQKIESFRLEM